jgi:hypothetical protein
MRVVLVGNFQHPWCSEVHFAREYEHLGHEVVRFQEPPGGGDARTLDRLWETATKPARADLVTWTRTWGMPSDATRLWRALEAEGITTASYHLDLYLPLKRAERMAGDPFWTTQHVFTPDGDPNSARTFERLGINHHWSPPAVVSDECVPGTFRPEFAYDVGFVGSYHYHEEWPWRRELIDWLTATYGHRFRRWGGDQPGGPVRGLRLNDLYASVKVVVGDSLCLPGHVNYWSDRPYETLGRGGFLVMPDIPGLRAHIDGHVAWFDLGDLDDLHDVIENSLEQGDEWRRSIAKAGQEHVAAHHTYRHRLADALEVMGFDATANGAPDPRRA